MTQEQTSLRDINVYVNDGIVNLYAYPFKRDDEGFLETNYDGWMRDGDAFQLVMNDPNCYDEIAWVLESRNWFFNGFERWQDYDAWHTSEWLTSESAPQVLRDWVESLPAYTIEGAEA